jgi:hypothetical protein
MRNSKLKPFLPIILVFILLNSFFIAGKNMLTKWGVDQNVLLIGNILLFLITFVSYLIAVKGMNNKNPHAFVRSAYGSIMVKLFVCIIAAVIYIAAYRKELNKPALFTLMGLYLLYTFIEVSVLTKSLKSTANG